MDYAPQRIVALSSALGPCTCWPEIAPYVRPSDVLSNVTTGKLSMTLILGLTVGDAPILMGDTLVTNSGDSPKCLHTPAVEDVNKILGETVFAHVVELRQKVNVLSDNVILAWTGSYIHAYSIFREVADALRNPLSAQHVPEIIKTRIEEEKCDLAVIGLLRGDKTTKLLWSEGTRHFDFPSFKHVVGGGSGAQNMASLIDRFEKGSDGKFDDPEIPDYAKAALFSLALGTQVVGLEHLTFENLWTLWGGGIEIALFSNGRAMKIGEVLYAFWDCCKKADGSWVLANVPTFVKLEYQGDLMVTRTVSATRPDRHSIIPPLLSAHARGDQVGVNLPGMWYDWLCSCILIRDEEKPIDVTSHVQGRGLGTPITFRQTRSIFPKDNEFVAEIDYRYIKQMADVAARRVKAEVAIALGA